jgi:hypothetical protein
MTGALRRLLIDHIRRGDWFWLMVGMLQVIAVFSYAVSPQTTAIAYPMMGAMFAPMILGVAEQRGWFQVLLTLPLSRRDIARARWWAAIGMPGLFLTALSLAAFAVFPALGWHQRPSLQVGLWLLTGWAILGLFAQARSWLRVRRTGGATAMRYLVAALYVALAIPALFFVGREGYWRPVVVVATAVGLMVDVYLYWRAERLLFWQVGRVGAPTSVGNVPSRATIGTHAAGWGVLVEQWGRRLALFAALSVLGLGLFAIIDVAQGGGLFEFLATSLLGLFVVLSCFLASPWLSAARAFRTLPVSADHLAAAFLTMTMAPAWTVLMIVLLASLIFPDAAAYLRAPAGLLSVALTALFAPMLLRFGQNAVVFIAVLILVPSPLVDPMLAIFHPDLLAEWMAAWVGAVTALAAMVGFLSFLWVRHELRAGRGAYRVAALPGQNPTG